MNLQATTNGRTSTDNTPTGAGGSDDNKAMAFLRKVGRVGGAANMDFATAMGLDESPSGGSKSSYHEGGFKVSSTRKIKMKHMMWACTKRNLSFYLFNMMRLKYKSYSSILFTCTYLSRMYGNQKQPTFHAQPQESSTTCPTHFHSQVPAPNGKASPTESWVVYPMDP